jgi:hypothetical protein
VNQYRSALVALLLAAAAAMPCAAQQVPSTPGAAPSEICAACFAYLEFSPSLEPDPYAMRGEVTENPTHRLRAADEPSGHREQTGVRLSAQSRNRASLVPVITANRDWP